MEEGQAYQKIAELLAATQNTVVVTGAGISTEAGIPDFRGEKGIYRTLGEDKVLSLLNINTFRKKPGNFYDFYRNYFMMPQVKPSRAHCLLAEMEKKGMIRAIVTQNIDNLHQEAGSKRVIAVHGNAERFVCTKFTCNTLVDADYVRKYPEVVPKCPQCQSILKPDVVLFGEPIQNHRQARDTILSADVLVVIGSSLTVYPLAGFIGEYCASRKTFIIINKGPTALDHLSTVKLETNHTGDALEKIYNHL
ncbi:MAG: Sir2 family NAD-dependent protein deacetylase [Syntrophaceticus schinkii]|nr:Sir2 family NAD-dependent protein deacetylase [Syntrophaceticus schinkii]MDD4261508.1 Sir2 family NAD-dependent protein deacetylase [Syntrophaceticus schinkii]MDD4675146.1 Sir2 family NAD-dependent protein deacetylase [Syntrophaceticus schinkii]